MGVLNKSVEGAFVRAMMAGGALVSSTGIAAPAFAQQDASQAQPPSQAPVRAPGALRTPPSGLEPAGEGAPEVSELQRLSRRADDPFVDQSDTTRQPISVTLRALDKITARYRDIEAPINELVQFGGLEITPRFCDKRPPEEFPETTAFLQIYDLDGIAAESQKNDQGADDLSAPEDGVAAGAGADSARAPVVGTGGINPAVDAPASTGGGVDGQAVTGFQTPNLQVDALGDLSAGVKIFSGWMFASSPALNPLEHSVYDIWVIDCKTALVDNSASETDANEAAGPSQ